MLADRSFSEEQFGIGLDLPPGWSFLSKSNPVIKTEDAIALAFHRKSGRFATLIVELVSDEGVALTNISTC